MVIDLLNYKWCIFGCDLGIKNTYQQYLDKIRHHKARCKVCSTITRVMKFNFDGILTQHSFHNIFLKQVIATMTEFSWMKRLYLIEWINFKNISGFSTIRNVWKII